MTSWTMEPYGEPDSGNWTISNGHIRFDIHILINGSGSMRSTPLREPGSRHWVVTPQEADAYAKAILETLNAHPVSFTKRYWDNINSD